jgi:hypothetical protein
MDRIGYGGKGVQSHCIALVTSLSPRFVNFSHTIFSPFTSVRIPPSLQKVSHIALQKRSLRILHFSMDWTFSPRSILSELPSTNHHFSKVLLHIALLLALFAPSSLYVFASLRLGTALRSFVANRSAFCVCCSFALGCVASWASWASPVQFKSFAPWALLRSWVSETYLGVCVRLLRFRAEHAHITYMSSFQIKFRNAAILH